MGFCPCLPVVYSHTVFVWANKRSRLILLFHIISHYLTLHPFYLRSEASTIGVHWDWNPMVPIKMRESVSCIHAGTIRVLLLSFRCELAAKYESHAAKAGFPLMSSTRQIQSPKLQPTQISEHVRFADETKFTVVHLFLQSFIQELFRPGQWCSVQVHNC